ncbi:uncharacterized protein B0H64DRAFT_116780 [Chaetomium fimeti]|uniref:Uncharacterized protein n=1 Tax=Chaetomium fimeti TaxID=1854472 RepID=A0AAE0LTD5_9PEZI|nr:hypothetical protein B0H64DRAFT_116780 [Chaetomium fimeti]
MYFVHRCIMHMSTHTSTPKFPQIASLSRVSPRFVRCHPPSSWSTANYGPPQVSNQTPPASPRFGRSLVNGKGFLAWVSASSLPHGIPQIPRLAGVLDGWQRVWLVWLLCSASGPASRPGRSLERLWASAHFRHGRRMALQCAPNIPASRLGYLSVVGRAPGRVLEFTGPLLNAGPTAWVVVNHPAGTTTSSHHAPPPWPRCASRNDIKE